LPSPADYTKATCTINDGSRFLEPYQRTTQSAFEAWLKQKCIEQPLITVRSGFQCQNVDSDGLVAEFLDRETQQRVMILAQYIVGCDGANSVVRKSAGIELELGPIMGKVIHATFVSAFGLQLMRDLVRRISYISNLAIPGYLRSSVNSGMCT
jgi:FAD-dependent monooxygenase